VIKGILIGKEESKLFLYLKDPKDSTRNFLSLLNTFSKVAGYKMNIQQSVVMSTLRNKSGKPSHPQQPKKIT
jgi:hypothetical protein